jgi:PAS domain S-box-containing protein
MGNNRQENNAIYNLIESGKEVDFIQKLLATIPHLVYVYDLSQGRYIYVNNHIRKLLGYEPSQILGNSAQEAVQQTLHVHPQDLEMLYSTWQKAKNISQDEVVIGEYRVRNAEEQWIWVRDNISIFDKNEQGEVTKLIGYVENITPQKDAERDIQKLLRHYTHYNKKLKEQNQILAEHEQRLMAANEELISQQEDLKMALHELSIKHQELDEVNEELISQQENLRMAFDALSIKNQQLDKANEVLIAQKDEMTKLMKELSDRNFELDQFVYKISHDIRSPFTSILGLVNLMKVETDPLRLHESVKHIEKSVLRLDSFVKSMLNFARISREESNPEEIFFYILIDECLNDFRYLENFDKIAVDIHIEDHENKFYSDSLRVNSIFRNIISNAIKYRNPYIDQSYLSIDIQVTPEHANITFADNGIGVKEEYLNKVFGMFVRATERSDGSGLGLYIVKQSVERMNGTIQIQSKYGEGTIINIILPNLMKQVVGE